MATNELVSLPQFSAWRVPQLQGAIEYPLDVMEEIRAFACEELLQVSRGGNEVGGVLFGTRRDGLTRVLTWRPIACEHAHGESLLLSRSDRMNLAVQLELARQNADLKDLRPVGCFLSHLQEGVCLTAADLETYNGFFPESWQVALVICPKGDRRADAGFFFREAEGKLQTEESYQRFELQPLRPASPEGKTPAAAAMGPAPAAASQSVAAQPAAIQPAATQPAATQLAPARPTTPPSQIVPNAPPVAVEADPPNPGMPVAFAGFQTEERMPSKERWLWAVPILLAMGIAAFVLYERPTQAGNAIGLRATADAQTVQLVWDASARPVRNAGSGEIDVSDGGAGSKIALTSAQLLAGKMSYEPQSGDVGFDMVVYPANGAPVHDATRLVLPGFKPPTEPPQLLPSAQVSPPAASMSTPPADPAPPAADAALQQQIQQLKQELAKERTRADDMQNLVRILENRLTVQGGAANKSPRP